MADIEVVDFYTPSGWILLEAREYTRATSALEVYTPSGWRHVNVVHPADADTPFEVYTQSGWKGIKRVWPTRIDYFNDGDLAEWKKISGPWVATTNDPYEGSHHAEVQIDSSSNGAMSSTTTDGLNYYPTRGDIVSSYFQVNDAADNAGIEVARQDNHNAYAPGYHIEVDQRYDGAVQLNYIHDDLSATTLGSAPIDLSSYYGTYLELRIAWGDPIWDIYIYAQDRTELAHVNADESTYNTNYYNSGGIGCTYDVGNGPSRVKHDYIRKWGTV